jgi:hypothetical protein
MYTIFSEFPISPLISKDFPGAYEIQVQAASVSDGYHTMEDLYEHRHALFVALLRVLDHYVTPLNHPYARCWKSETHNDGTKYEGWFIAGITLNNVPWTGPIETQYITYHMPIKYWNSIDILTLEKAPPFDNFTPDDVIKRLLKV